MSMGVSSQAVEQREGGGAEEKYSNLQVKRLMLRINTRIREPSSSAGYRMVAD
jgi:hypothetical protein